jgi:hypothetical protein
VTDARVSDAAEGHRLDKQVNIHLVDGSSPKGQAAQEAIDVCLVSAEYHLPGPGFDKGTNGLGELTGRLDFKGLVSCSHFVLHSRGGDGWAVNYG